jgi:3-hydroxyisobutyrate dehydrogenase/2-hydroxy-3-oxopropionate reductase
MDEGQLHGGLMHGHLHVPIRDNPRDQASPRTVALLGTGKMGAAIAARLAAAGFELVVWNRTRSRAEALGLGRVASTPGEASRAASVVISSLTGADALRAAYLGPDGAIGGADRQLFIDMSTAGTEIGAELAAALASHGAGFVEAPILGSPTVVAAGAAAILAGGEPADLERAIPILGALGEVRAVGRLGQASRLKLVANSMLGDVIESAAELQVAGEAADLDPDEVFWVLQRIVPSLEGRRAGLVDGHHAPAQFALRDLRKDLDLAIAAFDASRTPLTHVAAGLVREAAARTPDLDISAVAVPYRGAAPSPLGTSSRSCRLPSSGGRRRSSRHSS